MAMTKETMAARIKTAVESAGFVLTGEHARTGEFIDALAEGVVDEIQTNAKANITSGSSTGQHPII